MCIQLPLLIQLLRLLASYAAIKLIIQLRYSYIATWYSELATDALALKIATITYAAMLSRTLT